MDNTTSTSPKSATVQKLICRQCGSIVNSATFMDSFSWKAFGWMLLAIAFGASPLLIDLLHTPDPYGLHEDEEMPISVVIAGLLFIIGGLVGIVIMIHGCIIERAKTGGECRKCGAKLSLVDICSTEGQELLKDAERKKQEAERKKQEEWAEKDKQAKLVIERKKREREAREKCDKEWVKDSKTSQLIATYRSELQLLYTKLQVLHTKRAAMLTSHQASEDVFARRGGGSLLGTVGSMANMVTKNLEDSQIEKEISAIEADIKEREDTIAKYDKLCTIYQVGQLPLEESILAFEEKKNAKFCPQCGNKHQEGENFCSKCGNKF